ncbi:hypothetical protein [Halopenitus persicus]|uniref:Uncharacterized protein n=1 Tax=Halopenitus persicus TaxID=1048396 RepID=A0A1H3MFP7_9EURY|nr:hypothetical protein [Halopenitus persicus]SDY75491.1 hypothetical protein SAMN05216564_10981 [Halopenitus persicus]
MTDCSTVDPAATAIAGGPNERDGEVRDIVVDRLDRAVPTGRVRFRMLGGDGPKRLREPTDG